MTDTAMSSSVHLKTRDQNDKYAHSHLFRLLSSTTAAGETLQLRACKKHVTGCCCRETFRALTLRVYMPLFGINTEDGILIKEHRNNCYISRD